MAQDRCENFDPMLEQGLLDPHRTWKFKTYDFQGDVLKWTRWILLPAITSGKNAKEYAVTTVLICSAGCNSEPIMVFTTTITTAIISDRRLKSPTFTEILYTGFLWWAKSPGKDGNILNLVRCGCRKTEKDARWPRSTRYKNALRQARFRRRLPHTGHDNELGVAAEDVFGSWKTSWTYDFPLKPLLNSLMEEASTTEKLWCACVPHK